MTRYQVFSSARISGHVAWWTFVVSTLFAGGLTWLGDGREFFFVEPTTGWTAYTPLTDSTVGIASVTSSSFDRWTDPEVYSLLAFVVVVMAAVVEAIAAGQLPEGVATVAAPCVALGLMLSATADAVGGQASDPVLAMGLVLVAVAVREVWARRFAPSLPEPATR